MATNNTPLRCWDFALVYKAEILSIIARGDDLIPGLEKITGETVDITEYLDSASSGLSLSGPLRCLRSPFLLTVAMTAGGGVLKFFSHTVFQLFWHRYELLVLTCCEGRPLLCLKSHVVRLFCW